MNTTSGNGALAAAIAADDVQIRAKTHETAADVRNWSFSCRSQPAMSSDERDALARELHLKPLVSLPEMVFARSRVVLQHTLSGLSIQFKAATALHMWAAAAHSSQKSVLGFV